MKSTPLKEIAHLIGTKSASTNMASGVAVDTRLLQSGDLFFALPGAKVDGHLFLQTAAAAGATGAVVSTSYKGNDFGLPLLFVPDVLLALQNYSKSYLQASKATVVAVTGSLGKTTTKGFIASLLKHRFKVSASPGNSNSQIGLPLAILNHTSSDDEVIILEMGMTMSGQLSKLIEIAPPHIAVVTTVALVHAENFDSLEGIVRSKAEIFTHPSTRLGIYHTESDISHVLAQAGSCAKQTFSTTSQNSDFFLNSSASTLEIHENQLKPVHLPYLSIPGMHNRHNFLAAVAIARNLGMEWEEIKSAQSTLGLPERRLEIIEKQGVVFVNDAYNASEMSMKSALDSLPQPRTGGKKIAFLGGMVELGKFSIQCHQSVAKHALNRVDMMFCFGDDCLPMVEEWKSAGRPVIWTKERDELVSELCHQMQPGDVVLLKGSRSKGVCKVLEMLPGEKGNG
ncbi:MAG TPA: UDP-N-acetylmuramoyl-tripeptide--D-alanyl-D-alanine ligase [Parachlamydiaceae bacterium]|nr:UDP-N-acetylmuramoyl-tripeptide--D-alanyl-D-alanine ligase [Parachlamydiaceae bacterium]